MGITLKQFLILITEAHQEAVRWETQETVKIPP
jgi:hypothetical protein